MEKNIERITSYLANSFPERKEDAIALQKFYYSNWDDLDDGEANRQQIVKVFTKQAYNIWCH